MRTERKTDQLFRLLHEKLRQLPDGAAFPSVRQLMAEYSVSQATVTATLKRLLDMGLIESRVGSGTVVRQHGRKDAPKILLLANDWPSAGIAAMVSHVCGECARRGLRVEVAFYPHDQDVCARLNEYEADVIIVESLSFDLLSPEQAMNLQRNVAPVIVSRLIIPLENVRYVTGNNAAAGVVAANHLYQAGHRDIALLYSEPHLYTVDQLVRSFSLCARSNGCAVKVLDCQTRPGVDSGEQAYRMTREVFGGTSRLEASALFVVSSESCLGALRALDELEIGVPGDLSVVGFGGVPAERPMTCVNTPYDGIAAGLLDMAQELLAGRFDGPKHVEVDPVVLERGTVRRSDTDIAASATASATVEEVAASVGTAG